jgi:hypothetical protein
VNGLVVEAGGAIVMSQLRGDRTFGRDQCMTNISDSDLSIHGAATLLASWEEHARGSSGAALRSDDIAGAVFPAEPGTCRVQQRAARPRPR